MNIASLFNEYDDEEKEVDESSSRRDFEREITDPADDIAEISDEIDSEEQYEDDDEMGDDMDDAEAEDDLDDMEIGGDDAVAPEGEPEEAIPAKLDDLEAAVEELKAEFDRLMAGDEEVPADDAEAEMGDEMGDAELGMDAEIAPEEEAAPLRRRGRFESKDEDDDGEELDEARTLDTVAAAKMGDDGDASAKSLHTGGNVKKADMGVSAVKFASGDEKGRTADKPGEGMTTNQDAKLSAGPKAEAGDKSDKGAGSLVKDMR